MSVDCVIYADYFVSSKQMLAYPLNKLIESSFSEEKQISRFKLRAVALADNFRFS